MRRIPLPVFCKNTIRLLFHPKPSVVQNPEPPAPVLRSNDEVDFILKKKNSVIAIEIKSNAEKNTKGLENFKKLFHPKTAFIVGDGGISAENFLSLNIKELF